MTEKLQRTFFLSQQLKNIDELQLQNFILKCKHLENKFLGVIAADNFPSELPNNVFVIVNASKSDSSGTHWIVICNRKNNIYFADPLGIPLSQYKNV